MRIYVGYCYGPGAELIPKHLYRLVDAFGSKAVDGKVLYAAPTLADGVNNLIQTCDAIIGIVSREATTRPWVLQELGAARGAAKQILLLCEKGVLQNAGMLADRQHIEYDPDNLAECLIAVVEALGEWHAPRNLFVYLLPDAFAESVGQLLHREGLVTTYEVLDENHEPLISQGEVKLVRIDHRIQAMLRGIPPLGRYIRFRAVFETAHWESDWETVNSRTMTMKQVGLAASSKPAGHRAPAKKRVKNVRKAPIARKPRKKGRR